MTWARLREVMEEVKHTTRRVEEVVRGPDRASADLRVLLREANAAIQQVENYSVLVAALKAALEQTPLHVIGPVSDSDVAVVILTV